MVYLRHRCGYKQSSGIHSCGYALILGTHRVKYNWISCKLHLVHHAGFVQTSSLLYNFLHSRTILHYIPLFILKNDVV